MSDQPDNGDTKLNALLASRLNEARRVLGLTQTDVAQATGLPRTAVSDIEHGHRKVSGVELLRLARLYHRSLGWFLGEPTRTVLDEVISAVAVLSEQDRAMVLAFARFLHHQSMIRGKE